MYHYRLGNCFITICTIGLLAGMGLLVEIKERHFKQRKRHHVTRIMGRPFLHMRGTLDSYCIKTAEKKSKNS